MQSTAYTALDAQVIFSAQPDADVCAVNELHKSGCAVSGLAWLHPGVGKVTVQGGFAALAAAFASAPPIFVRHICPAQAVLPQSMCQEDIAPLVLAAQTLFVQQLDAAETFSVQTVFLGDADRPYKRVHIGEAIAEALSPHTAGLDVKNPAQVISVVQCNDHAYLGLSLAKENLSAFAGGMRRFAREEGQVSRAEFKLMEALEHFGVPLPKGGVALDLGAAPGGWTRVLRAHGLRVVAVDPALLAPEIAADPGVTHFRGTSQQYLPGASPCDLIVNDMRMDAVLSAQILCEVAQVLRPGGHALITLKLPQSQMQKRTKLALAALGKRYEVVAARQLFHNRSEVTVLLRPL